MREDNTPGAIFTRILRNNQPDAIAWMNGNGANPQLKGAVRFFSTPYGGILIEAEIFGLPNLRIQNATNFYAMHIHQKGDCIPPFDKTGEHYNPTNEPHPEHVGDLLPILGNQGYAWSAFYNKRIALPEIMGRSVIIHSQPDDFKTQPSGASGEKIACGVIKKIQ